MPFPSNEANAMHVLIIVFLVSQVTVTSMHASLEVCERLAEQARSMKAGSAAIESARCEPVPSPLPTRP